MGASPVVRLSEDRIQYLARRMARTMIDSGAVDAKTSMGNLSTLIAQVIIKDLEAEDEIDAEVRRRLARIRTLPPPGTGEYEAHFQKTKQQVAGERGYPL